MKINDRVRYLRKEILKTTQKDFAEEIKISRSNLGNIEIGEVSVTARVIFLICEKFDINEEWLRTGKGDPQKKKTRNQEITAFMNDVMEMPDKSIKKRLIEALAKSNERDWETIGKLLESLTGE